MSLLYSMLQPFAFDADAKISVLFGLSLGKPHQQRPYKLFNSMKSQLLY